MPENENKAIADGIDGAINAILARIYRRDPDFQEFQALTDGLLTSAIRDSMRKIPVAAANSFALYQAYQAKKSEEAVDKELCSLTSEEISGFDNLPAEVKTKVPKDPSDPDKPRQMGDINDRIKLVDDKKNRRELSDKVQGLAAAVEGNDVLATLRVEGFDKDIRKMEEVLGCPGKYSGIIAVYDLANSLTGLLPVFLTVLQTYAKAGKWSQNAKDRLDVAYKNVQIANIASDLATVPLRILVARSAFHYYKKLKRKGYRPERGEDGTYRMVKSV